MTRKGGTLRTKGGETEIQGIFNYAEDGAISFTAEGSRCASFFMASEWEFVPDPPTEPDMPYGVYVAKIWTHSPESGVKWVHKRLDGKDTWKALTFDCEGDRSSSHSDHPRDFYAGREGNWWDYITRLVAEQPQTR